AAARGVVLLSRAPQAGADMRGDAVAVREAAATVRRASVREAAVPGSRASDETLREPAAVTRDPMREPVRETVREPVRETMRETVRESAREPVPTLP
ncbi:hypothetical protein KN815_25440, partial [Streptomyces sp. 4503]|nr:hypothetical protein [Streptomyces niphimycinicus]